ncbi:MAG: bifunctional nuclease family protein [Saprospiraceae bacterium]|nr:bifunctional nuclease family protein [Saprospiraceae bacterium]
MKKIALEIVALSHSVSQSHNYAVVLGEVGTSRRLPIVIGAFEAQAIAVAMERMSSNRPLTHDLIKNTLEAFDINLKEVIINNLVDGIFYSRLICVNANGTREIDSRTSDAIALAVRFQCPIYTYDFILENAGVILDETEDRKKSSEESELNQAESESSPRKENKLSDYSIESLIKMLDDVLHEEDYEKAAKIRDELKKRKEQG